MRQNESAQKMLTKNVVVAAVVVVSDAVVVVIIKNTSSKYILPDKSFFHIQFQALFSIKI